MIHLEAILDDITELEVYQQYLRLAGIMALYEFQGGPNRTEMMRRQIVMMAALHMIGEDYADRIKDDKRFSEDNLESILKLAHDARKLETKKRA